MPLLGDDLEKVNGQRLSPHLNTHGNLTCKSKSPANSNGRGTVGDSDGSCQCNICQMIKTQKQLQDKQDKDGEI